MSTLCTWQDIAEATLFTSLGSDFTVPLKLLHPANFWYPLNWSQVVLITKYLLVRGCETCVAVVGMTSVLSAMITQLGDGVSNFLPLDDADDRAIGTVSGVLFFILALQNGLTGMVPEKRMMRLYRNFCLIFTAILHFIHNRVSPIMYTLSASRNPSPTKHARVLIVCASVIVSSIVFLNYIWTHHTLSTWLFAVTAFSVEIIIKVSGGVILGGGRVTAKLILVLFLPGDNFLDRLHSVHDRRSAIIDVGAAGRLHLLHSGDGQLDRVLLWHLSLPQRHLHTHL